MAGGTHAQGAFSQMLLELGSETGTPTWDGTWDGSSLIQEYLSENIQKHARIIGGNELTGSRSHRAERAREGAAYFYGSITKYISAAELNFWLKCMLGDNESPADTFGLAEDLPYFAMLFNREEQTIAADDAVFQYTDCKVDRWVLRGRAPEFGEDSQPDMITLQLFIIASDEKTNGDGITWPVSPPTLGTAASYSPYTFCDSSSSGTSLVKLFGSVRDVSEFVIAGDNKLYARYTNSCTPHSIIPRDRIIQARVRLPYNDTNHDIYDSGATPDETAAANNPQIGLVNGSNTTTFNFESAWLEQVTPSANRGKQEIELIANLTMRDTDADSDEVVVNNVTA